MDKKEQPHTTLFLLNLNSRMKMKKTVCIRCITHITDITGITGIAPFIASS